MLSARRSDFFSAIPTVSTSAYADGHCVGGKIEFEDSDNYKTSSGVLHEVIVADKDGVGGTFELVLFNEDPVNTTFTDNAAFTIDAADRQKVVGVIDLTTVGTVAGVSLNEAPNVGKIFRNRTEDSLYAALIAKSAFTFSNTDALKISLGVIPD